jgi:hypothetical protein
MKIVVSRYNEDVAWIDEFREHVVLYNKGPDAIEGAHVLPNVGREGHTIFHYICENYANLDDFTIFLQGNPFDHSPDICEQLRTLLRDGGGNADFAYFNPFRHTYNLLHGCRFHWGLPIASVYEILFDRPAADRSVEFGCGAQFIVSRERILRRPRAFYQKIVDMLGYHYGPDEGYVIERMHPLIFGDE